MYILVHEDKFLAGENGSELIWTELSILNKYPCQVVLYPTGDYLAKLCLQQDKIMHPDLVGSLVKLSTII